MERLTIPDVRVDEHTTRRSVIDVAAVREHAMEFYCRLKAYEDTGLEPEEIKATLTEPLFLRVAAKALGVEADRLRELAEADKDGRCVVLLCKVGDIVYGFHGEKTILPMVAKWIETNTDGWCIAAQYTPMAPRLYGFSDFGKTVFLTREEAEKALREMQRKEAADGTDDKPE